MTKLRHHTAQDDNVLRLCRNGGIVFYKPNAIQLLQHAFLQFFAVLANDCVAIRDTLDGFVKSNLQGISDGCKFIGKSLDEEHRFGFVGRGIVVADIYRYDVGVATAQAFCREVDAVIIEIDKLPDFAFCVLTYARIVLVVKDVTHGSDRNACLSCNISHCDFLAHNNRIIQS